MQVQVTLEVSAQSELDTDENILEDIRKYFAARRDNQFYINDTMFGDLEVINIEEI